MVDRDDKYTPKEFDAILDRAIERTEAGPPGVDHATLVEAAAEVGVPRDAVEAAAREVRARRTRRRSRRAILLGGAAAFMVAAAAVALLARRRAPAGGPRAMVAIPAGTFSMGSTDGRANELPVHVVHVAAFEMDRTEVTVAGYDACVRDGACVAGRGGVFCNAGVKGRENDPMNCVSWGEATTYCDWAGARLPTEEEWEYAARGSAGSAYPWGDARPKDQLCWLLPPPHQGTCPVGSFPAGDSTFGIADMAGNVWEWTSSAYSKDYGSPRSDPAKVDRGGDFNAAPPSLRAAYRSRALPSERLGWLGFRCAR